MEAEVTAPKPARVWLETRASSDLRCPACGVGTMNRYIVRFSSPSYTEDKTLFESYDRAEAERFLVDTALKFGLEF